MVENADTVSLVCALLVRFPELASIRSLPGDRTVRLTFALRQRLDRGAQSALIESIEEHILQLSRTLQGRARAPSGWSAKATGR